MIVSGAVALLLGACTSVGVIQPPGPPFPAPVIAADSARADAVAAGVVHRYYWIASGPWAVNVLDVDRAACWAPVALKGGARAVGREKTSLLVSSYADSARRRGVALAGGVNADFFSFSPPGVPVGAHIHDGQVITGPVNRPILAMKRDGTVTLGALSLLTKAQVGEQVVSLSWNHPQPGQLTIVDNAFGERTDSASGAVEAVLRNLSAVAPSPLLEQRNTERRSAGVVVTIDTTIDGVTVPRDGFLIVAGARADSAGRRFVRDLDVGDTVSITRRFDGDEPLEAVGGFPMLMRSDSVLDDVNTAGATGFRGRHPRTAVGIGAGGRRLLLVTVDGRQPGYSVGMTLAELADLMQRLGASDALNLDGGGSTTFVVVDRTGNGTQRIANRPSDPAGERPVGNALGVEGVCGRGIK